MRKLLKSWVFWGFAVPACVLPFLVGPLVEETYLQCRCGSWRIESWSRFGRWQDYSVRLSGRSDREIASKLWTDILRDAHAHVWMLQYSFVRPRDGRVAFSCPARDFAEVCTEPSGFYAWLKARCDSGAISPDAVELEVSKGLVYPRGLYPFAWTPPP